MNFLAFFTEPQKISCQFFTSFHTINRYWTKYISFKIIEKTVEVTADHRAITEFYYFLLELAAISLSLSFSLSLLFYPGCYSDEQSILHMNRTHSTLFHFFCWHISWSIYNFVMLNVPNKCALFILKVLTRNKLWLNVRLGNNFEILFINLVVLSTTEIDAKLFKTMYNWKVSKVAKRSANYLNEKYLLLSFKFRWLT